MATKIANKLANRLKLLKSNSDLKLMKQAIKALAWSYSPYSKFKVGVAILKSDGKIYQGANLENAAYPLCLCAERTAIAHAHMAAPLHHILALAVVCKRRKSCPKPNAPLSYTRRTCAFVRGGASGAKTKPKARMKTRKRASKFFIVLCSYDG